MRINNFTELLEVVKKQPPKRVVAVNGVDVSTLEAMHDAVALGFVTPIITGDKNIIEESCKKLGIDVNDYQVYHTNSLNEATEKAVELIHEDKADVLMKGMVSTDKFMRALLKKEFNLVPSKGTLSHISAMDNPNYHKMLLFSDAAVLPYPDLKQKILMTNYLLCAAKSLGIEDPKLAVIAPTEQIIISIPSCMDGATIAKMAEHGQIEGGLVDGPMALDVAINAESAEIKGFTSPVAGDADCLLFPNIDAANVFYKTNSKLAKAEMSGIIAGAKVPVVVSSRGDSRKTKLNSVALASIVSYQASIT
ncbi:phosphate acyltransferase [Draconibacterium sp. IB214405]|uniref:phosphate acyltransferase n=1 Tax=Draconibacterium sp. IB214405 TaxID=3097352 RepID=UPI002A0AC260|nr:phosphate acyltransferase [Draconibacterium sp. IB214405]MDX8340061.1 phosphate acyltransferase [Draconibacterium sp. IB214405]